MQSLPHNLWKVPGGQFKELFWRHVTLVAVPDRVFFVLVVLGLAENAIILSMELTVRDTIEGQSCCYFSNATILRVIAPEYDVTFSLLGTNFQVVCTH